MQTKCVVVQRIRVVKEKYNKCEQEPYNDCKQVPEEKCFTVTKERCEDEPYEECNDVTTEVCEQQHFQVIHFFVCGQWTKDLVIT